MELLNVDKSFGENKVLQSLNIVFPSKGFVGIIGHSGCGKTTLLRLLSGLDKPDFGQVKGIEDKKISFVFQEDRLIDSINALENLLAVNPDKKRCIEILQNLGLKDDMYKYPLELSGGMKRRVAIGRALAFGGDIFFFDEGFKGIDELTKVKILKYISDDISDKLVFFVTHHVTEINEFCQYIINFENYPIKCLELEEVK